MSEKPVPSVNETAQTQMVIMNGLAISRGLAEGPAFLYNAARELAVPEYVLAPQDVPAEVARYEAARAETRRQLEKVVSELGGGDDANIFANHLMMVDDALIVEAIRALIEKERINTEAAMRRVVGGFRASFARMSDPYLRERARDIDDVESRMLRVLLGETEAPLAKIDRPVVLVADDLTPSETVALPRAYVRALVTERGSTTSHVALLARSMGIPAVAGLGDALKQIHAGETLLVDGARGWVALRPDAQTRADFSQRRCESETFMAVLDAAAESVPQADALPVSFCANVEPGIPFDGLSACGAQGIGLYRSEYLWINTSGEPTEDVQSAAYIEAVRAAATLGKGARCVFRAFDLGGDKFASDVKNVETNPFLGNRSLRWLLSHKSVFRAQLRAILKASAYGPAAVMYPMVATREELREANAVLREAMDQLYMAGIAYDAQLPKGVMIEMPSAALNARALAREADFFSVGTNDLVQYTMAADRGNAAVAHLYQPTNPAVIRLMERTVRAAREAGIPVAVCGESASDPVLAMLWAALGVDELSMSPSFISPIRRFFSAFTRAQAEALAAGVRARLDDADASEIYGFCRTFLLDHHPARASLACFLADAGKM